MPLNISGSIVNAGIAKTLNYKSVVTRGLVFNAEAGAGGGAAAATTFMAGARPGMAWDNILLCIARFRAPMCGPISVKFFFKGMMPVLLPGIV